MIFQLFFVMLAVVALYGGATLLVRGAANVARRLGMSTLVVGLTVVAFATSMPEFLVSIQASLGGTQAIAVGNVIGSNIANLALILGVVALVYPLRIELQIVRSDVPILLVVTAFTAALLWLDLMSRVMGIMLLVLLALYLWYSVRLARRVGGREAQFWERQLKEGALSTGLAWSMTAGGLGLLVFGAQVLIQTAMDISVDLGVEDVVVGLSIVALATSLPELATAAVAAIDQEGDLAVGQLIGSSIFNLLGVLGATAAIRPITDSGIRAGDLIVLFVLTLLVLPLMRTGFKVGRVEGATLAAVYGGYLVWLFA